MMVEKDNDSKAGWVIGCIQKAKVDSDIQNKELDPDLEVVSK